jgi:hypothetical protein
MKKKISSIIIATTLLCPLLFSGCGKKAPTADDLLSSAWGSEPVESIDMDIDFAVDADIDVSQLMGDTSTSGSTMMNMKITCNLNAIANLTDSYINGKVDASLFGMSFSEPTKTYITTIDGQKYSISWDEDDSCWYKTAVDEDTDDNLLAGNLDGNMITSIDSSIFESYELQEIEKDDTVYTVTGTIDYDKLADKMDMDISDLMSDFSSEDTDFDNAKFDVTMTFDIDTQLCKTIDFVFDTETLNQEDTNFNELTITLTINQINDVDVEVPQDVIDSAISTESNANDSYDYTVNDSSEDVIFGYDAEDDYSESDSSDSSESLSYYLFGTDYVYTSDIESALSSYYTTMPSDDIMISLSAMINTYDIDSFSDFLSVYDYWDENEKGALAVMYDIGLFDENTLTYCGVDIDDLQTYVDALASCK